MCLLHCQLASVGSAQLHYCWVALKLLSLYHQTQHVYHMVQCKPLREHQQNDNEDVNTLSFKLTATLLAEPKDRKGLLGIYLTNQLQDIRKNFEFEKGSRDRNKK